MVVIVQVRGGGDGIVFPGRESPVAPLLRVTCLKDAGDEGWACGGRDLVDPLLGAGAVEVAAACGASDIGVESLVLGAEAGGAVDWNAGVTEREESLLHVIGVVSQVGPWLATAVFAELGVDCGDICGGIDVRDIVAELEKVLGAEGRVPI